MRANPCNGTNLVNPSFFPWKRLFFRISITISYVLQLLADIPFSFLHFYYHNIMRSVLPKCILSPCCLNIH